MQRKKGLTLKKQIYNSILNDLLAGKYVDVEVLREAELMEVYGASKSSVREALIELCSDNILKSIPRFGYQIIRLTENDVSQILAFRKILEKETLIYIWHHCPHSVFSELKDFLVNDCVNPSDSILDHWLRNKRFHLKFCAYAGNKYIYEELDNLMSILTRAYMQFHYDEWKKYTFRFSDDMHLAILDALLEENLEKAIELLITDIGTFQSPFTS